MLKLSRLDINGFKSFVDPVTLRIASGITAIVGPNGCGKSNLADAITWVLGEQSAKSLRGSKMEDIIFNGSAGRKPVGMAEVTLTLTSDPSFPAAVDGTIGIGRRVFRSGQSQYRLNGKVVRLKEIKDLLMDTGLGIRAYSVIEQGKIGMILSGKPQERRKLLEEAAGITRYKARKRIAEIKLEEALSNLLRLDDIISEVERALRSLKRQAGAARRYQQRNGRYRELLDRVLRGRWYVLRQSLDELEGRLRERLDEDAALSATLHRDEAGLAEGRESLDVIARQLAERHERQAALSGTIEGRQAFLEGARETVADIARRLERGARQHDGRQTQIAELHRALGSLDARTIELIEERDEAARLVADDDARLADAQRAVEQAQAAVEAARQGLLGSLNRVNDLQARLQRQLTQVERGTLRDRYLDEERQRLEKQLGEAESVLAAVGSRLEQAEAALAAGLEQRRAESEKLDQLLRQESELADRRRRLEAELATLRQRQKILIQLSVEHAERRKALDESLAAIGIEAPRFLADQLHAAAGWERSVDHYLGELADAVLLEAGDDALALARKLAAKNASGSFLRPRGGAAAAPTVDDPAIVFSLAEALALPAALADALPPAYLVDDAADAVRLAAAHPGIAFLSRDRLWAAGGILRVQGAEAAPGVLARARELELIRAQIPDTEASLAAAGERLHELVAVRSACAAEIQQVDDRIAELRREIAVDHARHQDGAARRDKLRASHQTVTGERTEIAGQLHEARAERQRLASAQAAAEAEHTSANRALDQAHGGLEAAKEAREALRTAGAGRRGRLELLEERLEGHGQEVVRIRQQGDEVRQHAAEWQREAAELEQRREQLTAAIAQAEAELQAALERRAAAQEDVLAEQERLDHQRQSLRALEARVATAREQRDSVRAALEALRIERAGIRQDGEHLAITYRDTFAAILPGSGLRAEAAAAEEPAGEQPATDAHAADGETPAPPAEIDRPAADPEAAADDQDAPASTAADAGDETAEPAPASPRLMTGDEVTPIERPRLAELEGELARAKTALERIGPVNVLAAEEYDEQHERHGFLTQQRTDVADSVKRLKETIREINETSGARFREAFDAVNRTFGEVFTKLFRGGEAEMRLFDEEDLLESGIEIVARPPGKRPQNIMLLSGGEKALTAVALLFALFQTRPSPFCILDEVDAPLDDANVLRFVEVLQEMALDTQFLIITHNKLTMEVASSLYGVTMEEKGISKLVAVELDQIDADARTRAASA